MILDNLDASSCILGKKSLKDKRWVLRSQGNQQSERERERASSLFLSTGFSDGSDIPRYVGWEWKDDERMRSHSPSDRNVVKCVQLPAPHCSQRIGNDVAKCLSSMVQLRRERQGSQPPTPQQQPSTIPDETPAGDRQVHLTRNQ